MYWFQTFRSPMAANIQFIFFNPKKGKSGDTLVKVLLNGEEAHLGDLEGFPYYRWDDVKAYLKARTGQFVFRPEEKGWTVKEVAPGLQYRKFEGSVDGAAQRIFTSSVPDVRTSDVFKAHDGAVVAMNACYESTSIVLKVDGEYVTCMPNNTIMSTGVPNWKNEGAVYTDGGSKVWISSDGKGKTDLLQRPDAHRRLRPGGREFRGFPDGREQV